MDPNDSARVVALLEEVRDSLAAMNALQKEQFELVRRQTERVERIQDRAEELQARGMGIMTTARRSLAIVLPIVILLILYLSWLIFR
jgi:uncharacterized membrane protein (DUF106 family)